MRSLSKCIDFALSVTRAPVPCQRQERLHTAEDTQPQYIEIRPAEDDTFLKFQVVYLRFDLPLAPLRRKRGFKLGRKYSKLLAIRVASFYLIFRGADNIKFFINFIKSLFN